jgi:hypothetical protein
MPQHDRYEITHLNMISNLKSHIYSISYRIKEYIIKLGIRGCSEVCKALQDYGNGRNIRDTFKILSKLTAILVS